MNQLCDEALQCLDLVKAADSAGKPVAAVFDLDNTLFDTRPRTVHAARSWPDEARAPADHPLRKIQRHSAGWDGLQTALDLGMSPEFARAFQAHWKRIFWSPEHFARDVPIPNMVALLHAVMQHDVVVWFLTGRIATLDEVSVAQLKEIGVQDPEQRLLSKPGLQHHTVAFKRSQLSTLKGEFTVAFSASDAHADVAASLDVGITGVWVDFPTTPASSRPISPDHTIIAQVPPQTEESPVSVAGSCERL